MAENENRSVTRADVEQVSREIGVPVRFVEDKWQYRSLSGEWRPLGDTDAQAHKELTSLRELVRTIVERLL